MLQHLHCKLQSTRSQAVLPNSWVIVPQPCKINSFTQSWHFFYRGAMRYWMMYQETYPSQSMQGHSRGRSDVLRWRMLREGILFWIWCCGSSPAQWSHVVDTAGWQMWPINLILYKKSWSSEEAVVLPCECVRRRPRWGREGGEDRAVGFIPGESVCLQLQEGGKKGWFFSLGQCKLLAFGSQCQVFLLHY